MKLLFVIPARGGSKGIPDKNIKKLCGKPLIHYTIEIAKQIANNDDICVTTDSEKIKKVAEECGIKVPFLRPGHFATDEASTNDVILHALEFYKQQGKNYDAIVLLPPTTPLRQVRHVKEAIALFNKELDSVVSVKETASNPYYVLFEENSEGFLKKSKEGTFLRRQDCPIVYELNGAVFVHNVNSLLSQPISDFKWIKKYVMEEIYSIDIDNMLDWNYTEFLIKTNNI
jgi:CMP-N,N'-diacetyllegionaminic acid synthase